MNKIFLIGNLTRNPELRTTQSGVSVCSFGLAVNRRHKAEGQPDADFFNVTAWRGLAETVAKYLGKGRKVCVTGEVSVRTYEGRDGSQKMSAEVAAQDVEFLGGGKPQGAEGAAGAAGASGASGDSGAAGTADLSGFVEVPDEELPF